MSLKRRAMNMFMVLVMLSSLVSVGAIPERVLPSEGQSKLAQANTTPTVNIGDYIQFGKYNNAPILWRVIHKDSNGNPVLFSDRILTFKAYDAAGSYHIGNSDRVSYGSNYYPDSNIRQWLNSSSPNSGANLIDWIQNEPSAANLWNGFNPYNTEKGFLADGNFTESERALIMLLTHKVLLASVDQVKKDGGTAIHTYDSNIATVVQNYDTAYFKNVTDNVFLLSVKQLKEWVYDNYSILGSNYHMAKPTSQAVTESNSDFNPENNLFYWVNDPISTTSDGVRYVDSEGGISGSTAVDGFLGVRPALLLNLPSAIFAPGGTGTSSDPYVVSGASSGNADTQSPSAPSGLGASSVSATSLTLAWTASTDNVGVTAYEVYRGTTLIGTVTGSGGAAPATTYNVTSLTANTRYTFTVRAKDAAANVSAASNALTVTTLAPDTQAPTVPTGLASANATTTSLTLNWTASTDNVGVTAYDVYRGSTLIATVTGNNGAATATTYNVTDLTANSTYIFTVRAMDAAGNVSAPSAPLTVATSEETRGRTGSAPTDIALSGNKVVEFNWVGYEIGSFTATDADAGDTFTYSLVNGEGSEDNGDFTIDGNKLKAASILEFQENENFSIRVQVTDSTGNTYSKPFEIEVTPGNVRLNSTNKIATISLDRKLFDNSAAVAATPPKTLKDFVKISRNADANSPTYEALGANDTVRISSSTLVVTFENAITTEFNRIKVEANALKDLLNYKSGELLTTPLVTDKTGPTLSRVLMSRNKKSLELRFNERVLQTTTAANLKAAITIDRGTGTYVPLGKRDKVSIIKEYKVGRDTIRKLNRRVVQVTLSSRLTTLNNRIKINAGALNDFAGNNSLEIITPEIEDITGPELSTVRLSPNNKTITVRFNEEAAFGSGTSNVTRLSNLKSKIQLSNDGTTFSPLGETDTVALTGGNLVVTLATALTGGNNKLQVGSGAVKDMFDNFNSQLTTASIVADATPPGCSRLDGSLCDSLSLPQINENKRLQLVFNERVYKTATLKQAIQIKVGTAEYRALGSKDSVTTSGRRVIINFNRALAKDTTYQLKIAVGAFKDLTGNQNLALETIAFQVDTQGPKLR